MDLKNVMNQAGFKLSDEENINSFWYLKLENLFFVAGRKEDEEKEIIKVNLSFDEIERKGDLINLLDDTKTKNQICTYEISEASLTFNYNMEDFSTEFQTFLDNLKSILVKLEVKQSCIHCGEKENLSLYVNSSSPCILCNNCASQLMNQIEAMNNAKNNYLIGFFASLLGAIVGSAAWIFLGLIGWYASAAGYLIAFAAFWAYKKAGGKLTKTGVILNIICVVLGLIFAEYTGIVIALAKEFPEGNLLGYIIVTPTLFLIPEFLKHELISIGIGGLFAFLGCHQLIKQNLTAANNMTKLNLKKLA